MNMKDTIYEENVQHLKEIRNKIVSFIEEYDNLAHRINQREFVYATIPK